MSNGSLTKEPRVNTTDRAISKPAVEDLTISIPDTDLSLDSLGQLCTGLTALLGFRAHSLLPSALQPTWRSQYLQHFDRQTKLLIGSFFATATSPPNIDFISARILNLSDFEMLYTSTDHFAKFLSESAARQNRQLLPILDIRNGSYEFVLHAASLLAVIGLQDLSLLKDCAQWLCSVLQSRVAHKKPDEKTVSGYRSAIVLSPEFVRIIETYDSATIEEDKSRGKHTLRISLRRNAR